MEITSAEFKRGIRGTNDIIYEEKPQVAFIGRSNVGKSSLMNCLLDRKDLVKTGKKPGKTREINFFLVNHKVYFVDLPGYGFAKMSLEEREQLAGMIKWYFLEKVFNRKVVLVLDINVGPSPFDLEMLQILQETHQPIIVVANKADALNQKERAAQLKMIASKMPGIEIIPCSAKTKEGRQDILMKVLK